MPIIVFLGLVVAPEAAADNMLQPAGPIAERIERVWWEMLVVYGAVFIITMVILVMAMVSRRRERTPLGMKFVFVSGIAIPAVILVIMLLSTIQATVEIGAHQAAFRINVTSYHWWFEVYYPDYGIVDANEIHIPTGVVVQFELRSHAAVHSFWVPRLAGKRDMLPDHSTELRMQADKPGVYRGTCTEYCAGPHALMAFRLIAHEPEDFQQWLRDRSQAPEPPATPQLARGRDVFLQAGCAACHAIREVSNANTGPDLTLVGSRGTLGAGTVAHTPDTLASWIADPQKIKPDNMMPRAYLPLEDLHALTAYLGSLK